MAREDQTTTARTYDYRPREAATAPAREPKHPDLVAMRDKLRQPEAKALYLKRQQSVEPAFGIIKQAMGFRQFTLRGLEKVSGECTLVALAYNCKRLAKLLRDKPAAKAPKPAHHAPKHAQTACPSIAIPSHRAKGSINRRLHPARITPAPQPCQTPPR